MITLLLHLTLRGSCVLFSVALVDKLVARHMSARVRRFWWLMIPLAFLVPLQTSFFVRSTPIPLPRAWQSPILAEPITLAHPSSPEIINEPPGSKCISWLELVWLLGLVACAQAALVPRLRARRQWSRLRLETNSSILLNLLEDCKAVAHVTAPVGLVVSDQIAAPALLGWLRPRILLPVSLRNAPIADLRAILLHELAHFKRGDISINWLMALVRAVHWFNPLAWWADAAWAQFREEAADEDAIRWLCQPNGTSYGECVIRTLQNCPGGSTPCGALAIGESVHNLKRRILMIRQYPYKSNHLGLALIVTLGVVSLVSLAPTFADDNATTTTPGQKEKEAAVQAMGTWLSGIDGGSYAQSWIDSAKGFQDAITSDKWVAALTSVRSPLGRMNGRKLASAAYQNGIVDNENITPGEFVIAQFSTSFENLKSARETVTFKKEVDGTWKAAGYYIKPN